MRQRVVLVAVVAVVVLAMLIVPVRGRMISDGCGSTLKALASDDDCRDFGRNRVVQTGVVAAFAAYGAVLIVRHLRRGDNGASEILALVGCLVIGGSVALAFAPYTEREFEPCRTPLLDARFSVQQVADFAFNGGRSIFCIRGGYNRMRASAITGGVGTALLVAGNVRRRTSG